MYYFWMFFESAREARRLLAIMCIGFLANHRLCKHPQNQLVCVYQCLFTTFKYFSLHLIHSFMLDISKQFWIIDKANKWGAVHIWIYLFINRKAHGHACVDWYPVDDCRCAMLNLMRVRTISKIWFWMMNK